ncbi:hypothetical protein GCM10023079_05880 [Streptomyces chitinivorans]
MGLATDPGTGDIRAREVTGTRSHRGGNQPVPLAVDAVHTCHALAGGRDLGGGGGAVRWWWGVCRVALRRTRTMLFRSAPPTVPSPPLRPGAARGRDRLSGPPAV